MTGDGSAPCPRWILANLDCEEEQAALATGANPANSPPRTLSAAALRSASALGTLLRVFAAEDDVLWTPRPVDPARLADCPGLPRPRLRGGPRLPEGEPRTLLAWGETARTEAIRLRPGDGRKSQPASQPAWVDRGETIPLDGLPWAVDRPLARVAAMVNHRGYALGLREQLGCVLPGAVVVGGVGELERHLLAGGATAAVNERWILKAPHSAAGRSRVRGRGRRLAELGEATSVAIERLFDRHGVLVFEPWMERRLDFGSSAVVCRRRIDLLGTHMQEVDARGSFRALEIVMPGGRIGARETALCGHEREIVESVALEVGRALQAEGYSGPYSVDGWVYRGSGGERALQPLGEINARMSFGFVARALLERMLRALGVEPPRRARLVFSRGPLEPSAERSVRRCPLLLSGGSPDDATAAAFELDESPPG